MKKQINKMNLWVVDDNYLYSYNTLVGVKIDNTWMLTTKKYSRTTSKQLTIFSRIVRENGLNVELINQDKLNQL